MTAAATTPCRPAARCTSARKSRSRRSSTLVLRSYRRGSAPEGEFGLPRLFNAAEDAGRLFGLRLEGTWMHVGTPDAIAEAERAVLESVA